MSGGADMQPSDDKIRAMLAGAAQGPYIAKKAHHGPVDIFDANHFDIVTLYDGGDVRDHTAKLFAASWDLAALALSRGEALAKAEAEIARLRAMLGSALDMLDELVAESGRGYDWGEEDAFRMGEWFDDSDLSFLAEARAVLGGDDA